VSFDLTWFRTTAGGTTITLLVVVVRTVSEVPGRTMTGTLIVSLTVVKVTERAEILDSDLWKYRWEGS
jgi:hypothetical protein